MPKIFVVEDDVYLREEIISTFEKKAYSVSGCRCFANPEKEITEFEPDLIVLDVNLPGKSGYELCRWIKAHSSCPVLILTARDTLSDELTALGLGADDFITKPCHPDRLIARAQRLLMHYESFRGVIQAGEIMLDAESYKLVACGRHILLPETEGRILRTLIEKHPETVSAKQLFNAVWGTQEFIDENILQVNMTRLRKRLSQAGIGSIITTVRGRGYCLREDLS